MNNSKRIKCVFFNVLFGVLLVLVMSHSALAQTLASITGRVEDSSGAAIPGVMVTVTSLETGASRSIAADDSGSYRVVSLVVGRYEVKAEKVGFKTAVQTGVSLTVGQQAVVNITLAVGQVDQQVTVTSEAPLVNTTTAPTSGLVEEKEVKDLPLNGRSFDSLIALNTGAYPVTSLKNSGAGAQSGNVFSISGRRYGENLFLLNGVEYMGPSQVHSTPGGVSGQLLGIDAVREFNVLTDTYSADFGKRAGGQINIVTMSGTNQLHGTLFEFVRNNVFDARNPIDPADLPKRIPPFKRNQFGGALGGPIKKDKTFVFGNYEGFRQRLGLSQTAFVPWKYFRLGQVPDATTGAPVNVVAPAATLAKMEEFAANYWPLPTGPDLLSPTGIDTGVGPAVYNPLQSIREDMGIVRVDHTFSTKDTLGTTYLVDDGFNKNPQINPFWRMDSDIRSQVLSLQETHIFSPHLINNFTAGFSRASFFFVTPPNDGVNIPSDLILIKGQLPGRLTIGGGGNTSGGSISAAGSTIASNRSSFRNAFTYADNVQIIKGRHQISVGAWFERLQSNEFAPGNQAGVAVFGTLTTFLQGTVQSFAATPSAIRMYWRQLEGAWYVQDNIQVRPNLTVQIGLRHEFNDGYNEAQDYATNYYLVNGVFKTTPVVGSSIYAVNNAVKLFGPRVGIAWDPFGKGKTSVRAGFGTHFSMHDTLNTLDSNPPFNGTLNFTNQAFLPLIPIDPATPLAPTCGPGVPGSVTAAGGTVPGGTCSLFAPGGINQNAKTPTVEEWNFSVEQGFGSNMSLRISYVGSHGFHLVQSDNGNVIPPQTCAAAAGCPAGGLGSAASIAGSIVPTGTQYIPVTPKGNVPNPYVGAAGYLGDYGVSSYNAMSVEFTRRFSAGLQFKANYTWAKELDISDGYSGDPGVGNLQDYWNPIQSGYGLSGNNQKGRFVFSGGYELPIGKNKPFLSGVTGVADKLATGWQVNTIVTALTGFPFGPTTGINRSGNTTSGAGSDRPSYNPNFTGPIVTGNPNQWFNANAFILPAAGTFGNVPKNTLIGPNLRNVDISIFKTTTITERVKLQFRAEGFNVLNRSNWSNTVSGANSVFSGTPGTGLACFPSPAATGPTAGLTPCGGATTVSGSAGTIQSTATTSRQFQFGLKLIF